MDYLSHLPPEFLYALMIYMFDTDIFKTKISILETTDRHCQLGLSYAMKIWVPHKISVEAKIQAKTIPYKQDILEAILHDPSIYLCKIRKTEWLLKTYATQDTIWDFSGGKPQACHIDFPVCQHLEIAYPFSFPLALEIFKFLWLI